MKKPLLFWTILLSTIITQAQTNENKLNSISSFTAQFNRISGSPNIFTVLSPNAKPLSYNLQLNTVCFIQRKSPTYVTNPGTISNIGAVVAYLGRNMGTLWDSTLLYGDAINQARYPQGGIWNPPGNTTYTNAYVVGSGPSIQSPQWNGSWYASKRITSAGTNSLGADVQFFSNTGPNFGSTTSPSMKKQHRPQNSFASTDQSAFSLGTIVNDPNSTTDPAFGLRGAIITKGTFNSGQFIWTCDSLIPPSVVKSDGSKQLSKTPYMAWDPNGTLGYMVFIGTRVGSTGNNKGWQPIIYKTTNGGASWVIVNGIDFNSSSYSQLLNSLSPINVAPSFTVPNFDVENDIDLMIDAQGKLHIFTMIRSTWSAHNDSLNTIHTYTVGGNPGHFWKFNVNKWPYLVDFVGDGISSWSCNIIDSCGTQSLPRTESQLPAPFPWTDWVSGPSPPLPGFTIDAALARLQMSRSYDGEYVLYSWTETDTALTSALYKKTNQFPNIKMRCRRINDGLLSSQKHSVTDPTTGFHPRVKNAAFFHYMSAVSKYRCVSPTVNSFTVPLTVSNNISTEIGNPIDNYYSSIDIDFSFSLAHTFACTVGMNELTQRIMNAKIFPNPASEKINVTVDLNGTNEVIIELYDIIGKQIDRLKQTVYSGENNFEMDLKTFKSGIYLMKIKVGNVETTKKLIIE